MILYSIVLVDIVVRIHHMVKGVARVFTAFYTRHGLRRQAYSSSPFLLQHSVAIFLVARSSGGAIVGRRALMRAMPRTMGVFNKR